MSTLRVDNIKSRTGTVVTVPETNTLAVTGIVSVTSTGSITNAGNITNSGNFTNTGNLTVTGNLNATAGVITASNLNVTSTLSLNDLTVGGNLTVQGTTTTIDTVNLVIEDKNIGIGTTSTASNTTADGAGITIFGGAGGDKQIIWDNASRNWVLVGGGLSVTDYEGNFILDSYLFT